MTKGKTFHTTGARAWDTLARFSALQEFPRHLFQGSSACMECCLFQCAWWQQADQAFEAEESVVDSAAALLILLARPLPMHAKGSQDLRLVPPVGVEQTADPVGEIETLRQIFLEGSDCFRE